MKKFDKNSVSILLKLITVKEKIILIFSAIFALFSAGSKLLVPILFGDFVDKILAGGDFTLDQFFLIFAFIGLASISSYLFNTLLVIAGQTYIKDLRNLAFAKINHCSISYLDSTYKGDVVARVTTDCENLAIGIQNGIAIYVEGLFTIIFTIVFMFVVNYVMAIVVVFLTNFSILVTYFLGKRSSKFFKLKAKTNADITAFTFENLNNFDLDRSYQLKNFNLEEFNIRNEKVRESSIKSGWIAALVNPETRLVTNIIYAAVIMVGAVLTINPFVWSINFTIGNLTTFLSYTNQYMKPFNEISQVTGEISFAYASAKRINQLLLIEDDKEVSDNKLDENINSLEVQNVYFSYDKSKKILKNINFDIKRGQKIAIVGPTGCGKTTLINLLMRFYDIDSGDIKYNNISFNDLNKKSIRKEMTMVLQDAWIFNGTIKENIRYGNEEKTDEDIIEAAKLSTADDFISRLPDGYDTKISASSGLSSGEMQLICITRMLLNDPEFIILDEATSNVDTRTELKISKAMDKLLEKKTSIVIAHRLSTIKSADNILVIKNGEIIESGNHKTLMDKKGFYFELYNSQFE